MREGTKIDGRGTDHEPYVIKKSEHPLFSRLTITRENLQRLFFFAFNYPEEFIEQFRILQPKRTHNGLFKYGGISIKDSIRIWSSSGLRTTKHPPIKFKLITHEKVQPLHFKEMNTSYFRGHQNHSFAYVFIEELLLPLIERIPKGTRGKFKNKGTTLFWLKADASELFNLLSFLLKTGKHPSYFQKLLKKVNKSIYYKISKTTKSKADPATLTAYCIEKFLKNLGKPLGDIGVKSFRRMITSSSYSSFYTHYVKGWKPFFNYDEHISDSDLENLKEEPPFSLIFKTLGLI